MSIDISEQLDPSLLDGMDSVPENSADIVKIAFVLRQELINGDGRELVADFDAERFSDIATMIQYACGLFQRRGLDADHLIERLALLGLLNLDFSDGEVGEGMEEVRSTIFSIGEGHFSVRIVDIGKTGEVVYVGNMIRVCRNRVSEVELASWKPDAFMSFEDEDELFEKYTYRAILVVVANTFFAEMDRSSLSTKKGKKYKEVARPLQEEAMRMAVRFLTDGGIKCRLSEEEIKERIQWIKMPEC